MTGRPWYWDSQANDHDAHGMVLGVGRSGLIHYVQANDNRPNTACHSGAANFIELVYHGQVVTCRNCCSIARHNPHKIKMRKDGRDSPGVIAGASRMNFINRERARRTK